MTIKRQNERNNENINNEMTSLIRKWQQHGEAINQSKNDIEEMILKQNDINNEMALMT